MTRHDKQSDQPAMTSNYNIQYTICIKFINLSGISHREPIWRITQCVNEKQGKILFWFESWIFQDIKGEIFLAHVLFLSYAQENRPAELSYKIITPK